MNIFSNCIIQAPDGVMLSRCGIKKANWYIRKNLAEVVEYDPFVIRLKFEPNGRTGINDPFISEGKPNICVVCGSTDDLTRHHIIPYAFIKYLDAKCKVDIIRDIYPLCEKCHGYYETHSQIKRAEMAKDLNIPLHGIQSEDVRMVRKAMGAAVALLDFGNQIPLKRREELIEILKSFLNKNEIEKSDLENVRNYKISERNDYVNFSKFIAENVTDYDEFAKEWREHFVKVMNPKHMPNIWKINRKSGDFLWIPKKFQS